MGFALIVTTRYKKKSRVENSFSTASVPSQFSALEAFQATSIRGQDLSAKEQQSRCLLHADWMQCLASSNQRKRTASLRMSFQNVTKYLVRLHKLIVT